jgi:hypothetical protein
VDSDRAKEKPGSVNNRTSIRLATRWMSFADVANQRERPSSLPTRPISAIRWLGDLHIVAEIRNSDLDVFIVNTTRQGQLS